MVSNLVNAFSTVSHSSSSPATTVLFFFLCFPIFPCLSSFFFNSSLSCSHSLVFCSSFLIVDNGNPISRDLFHSRQEFVPSLNVIPPTFPDFIIPFTFLFCIYSPYWPTICGNDPCACGGSLHYVCEASSGANSECREERGAVCSYRI